MLTSSLDRFGYYTVGDYKTYSKLDAIEQHGRTKQSLEWNFNREVFEQFDWKQEPPGSLEFWYGQRARDIRNRYDYIVLWYSGGADSHNALMSFVKNNIFIDEIAQFHNLSGDKGNKQGWLNEEVFTTSGPITQDLIQNNPVYRHTKHRLVDLAELEMDVLTRDNNRFDYFYKVNTYLSPNALCRSYMRESVPDYQALTDSGKTVCFIYGAEKPHVVQSGTEWYTLFRDCLDYAVSPRTQQLNRQWEHNEMFYWSETACELLAKQAHVIRRFASQVTEDMVDGYNLGWSTPNRATIASWTLGERTCYLLSPGLHRLIYPYWQEDAVVCGKPPSLAYSSRDFWMFDPAAPDIGQRYYHYGLLKMRQAIWKVDPTLWGEQPFSAKSKQPYIAGTRPLYNRYRIA